MSAAGPAPEARTGGARPGMSPAAHRPAVFLDRDGTIVEERDYLADPEDVRLVPGAAAAIRRLRDSALAVVVVTNQSGIARGLYRDEDYHAVQRRLGKLLREEGAEVDATYYCPHHPDYTGPCDCRKPGPGMYRAAARDLGIWLPGSWFVGDKLTDVEPAALLGGRGILVRTGYGREQEVGRPPEVEVATDLGEAAQRILRICAAPAADRTGRAGPEGRGGRGAAG